jgi:hypothetical protein
MIKLPDGGENFIEEIEGDREAQVEQMYPETGDENMQRERVMSGMDQG